MYIVLSCSADGIRGPPGRGARRSPARSAAASLFNNSDDDNNNNDNNTCVSITATITIARYIYIYIYIYTNIVLCAVLFVNFALSVCMLVCSCFMVLLF